MTARRWLGADFIHISCHKRAQRQPRRSCAPNSQVTYPLDETGNLTSDGLKDLDHDASARLAQVRIVKDGEAAKVVYHHNGLGQRVFKSEPQAELGVSFIDWLKKNFGWLFAAAQANATLGQSYVYGDETTGLPPWALLGEYGNGGSKSTGRWEYVWLPIEDGSATANAIPVGVYKGGQIYSLHTDHLGTPRRASNEAGNLVWQWPLSGFGDNKPSGLLKATPNPKQALTNEPVLLKATSPSLELNLRYPGQYFDEETGLHYNLHRSYMPNQGRYTQADPIGLNGGSNRFGYVGGMPLGFTDPLGLDGVGATSAATSRVGSPEYGFQDWSWRFPRYGVSVNKCNIFVHDMLAEGGHPPALHPNGRPWLANEWANPSIDIPGYYVVKDGSRKAGDVIAIAAQRGPGHVGIFVPFRTGGGAVSATRDGVVWNIWGSRPGQQPVVRRCECDAN